tara:strand:- start:274 stop:426 length:153 start_codon:yes stop_codon:yes gene_type:complete
MITYIIVILSLALVRGIFSYEMVENTSQFVGTSIYCAANIIAIVFAANLY